MTKAPGKHAPIPTKEDLREFIRTAPGHVGKREIARAFHMTGDNRAILRQMLKELEAEGAIQRGRTAKSFSNPGALPDVMVLDISGTDTDGELMARPVTWESEDRPPRIYMAPERRGAPAIGVGDRVLARMRRLRDGIYEGRTIKRITASPAKVMGVYEIGGEGGRLRPTDRRQKTDYTISTADAQGALHGELVLAEVLPGRHYGLRPARVVERLGDMANPRSISLVAIHANDIPHDFPQDALDQASAAGPAPLGKRSDLRQLSLITIDGEDARDFDDAVFAEPDADPANPGGWHVIVAIADVAWYVRPGDALDRSAYERGNSVYFPDRVVPMLPEALSNGWCSLKPHEDRPCFVAHMWFTSSGDKLRHKFERALMHSHARLTYTQVQNARDGMADEMTAPLVDSVIAPLYGAWAALFEARKRRGVLELDLPERKVVIGEDGRVARVEPRARHDSHKLIEDMMIAANVAAAEQLEALHQPCMYRIHDQPAPERLESLREFLSSMDLSLAKGQTLTPKHFNQILEKAKDTPQSHLVSEVVLRSQAQAQYNPENIGHFGLGLKRYAHFTSPIRRYADLLVHRALVGGLHAGEGTLRPEDVEKFGEMGEHISQTERRAATAEREALNRFTAAFLADRVGATFAGRVNGVTRFGLFVTLAETGADGLVPISTLPEDYYVHDEVHHCLTGRRFRKTYRLGDEIEVLLVEANPLTGGLLFHILEAGAASAGEGAAARVRNAAGAGALKRTRNKVISPRKPARKPKKTKR